MDRRSRDTSLVTVADKRTPVMCMTGGLVRDFFVGPEGRIFNKDPRRGISIAPLDGEPASIFACLNQVAKFSGDDHHKFPLYDNGSIAFSTKPGKDGKQVLYSYVALRYTRGRVGRTTKTYSWELLGGAGTGSLSGTRKSPGSQGSVAGNIESSRLASDRKFSLSLPSTTKSSPRALLQMRSTSTSTRKSRRRRRRSHPPK